MNRRELSTSKTVENYIVNSCKIDKNNKYIPILNLLVVLDNIWFLVDYKITFTDLFCKISFIHVDYDKIKITLDDKKAFRRLQIRENVISQVHLNNLCTQDYI